MEQPIRLENINCKDSLFLSGLDTIDITIVDQAIQYMDDKTLNNALYYVCKFGHVEIVNHMVRNYQCDKNVGLLIASYYGKTNVILTLLYNGAQLDSGIHCNALLVACSQINNTHTVKLLIKCGAQVNAYDSEALMIACRIGCINTVKLLLQNGADINAQNSRALSIASVTDNPELVKCLINHGIKLNSSNAGKAIYLARALRHKNVINVLSPNIKLSVRFNDDPLIMGTNSLIQCSKILKYIEKKIDTSMS